MSPNSTEVATAIEAGWRPDPTGRYEWRYWDGGWTNRVASSRKTPSPESPSPEAERAASTPLPAPATPTPEAPVDPAAAPAVAAAAVPAAAAAPATPGTPASTPAPTPPADAPWRRIWLALVEFCRSFSREPESYHSSRAVDIEPDPRGESVLAGSPANYGRAGIVALAACGVAAGSYLPWLAGSIDGIPFSQTGFDSGHGWSYTMGTLALVCAALLAVRVRPLRWIAMALALALAGFTFRELVHVHDIVTTMNTSATIQADVGSGIWIMTGCAIVALVASCRLGERD